MNFKELFDYLKEFNPAKIVFVGLGNEYRGDDSAGLIFLRILKTQASFLRSYFINAGTNPENHLAEILLQDPSVVIFIDSMINSNQPVSIQWLSPEMIDSHQISTHAFSLNLIIEYLQKYMPMEVKVLGIGIHSNNYGQKISKEIMDEISKFFENV